ENKFLYIYLSSPGIDEPTQNSVVRYKLTADKLSDKKVIISGIPGAIYHDGGRMEFGPDGMLYVTTGDATTPALAQNPESLAGKILRLNDDGSIPKDNPFGTAVYSYGHRNPQGLAWDASGKLWETEHGRSGALSGLDELNLIKKGANYGWPEIEGDKAKSSMTIPALHSGPDVTWAPASLAYLDGYLYFGGLRGESLYRAKVDREKISGYQAFFKGEFGRIRTVRVGPDGMLYLTTSNRDGRGAPKANDDKIIRIDPSGL
ncbi:MAG: glucose sorbosone dehydrogenase, partial [Candidatus Colwellbacteria bacterium RIFCSPLOWO2_01_FULL_48_10]